MFRVTFLLIIGLLVSGCQSDAPLDLERLAGKARGGDAAAARQLVALLERDEQGVNGKVYALVLDIGPSLAPYLIEQVGSHDREMREHAIAALGNFKIPGAVEPIAGVLADRELGRRYIAAWALGEIRDPSSLEALIEALEDPDGQVRREATRALIKLNREAVPSLVEYLGKGDAGGAAGAIRALGDIGDRRALPVLLDRVGGANRADVLLALGKLKDPRAEAALVAALGDGDWRARMNAAMALGPLGGPAAVPGLRKTLEDEVLVVREWSARSLEMITGEHQRYRNAQGEYVAPYNIYH